MRVIPTQADDLAAVGQALEAANDVLASLMLRVRALELPVLNTTAPPTVTTPVRVLDTDFVIHSERNALVLYTVELTAPALITGTSSALVRLLVDGSPISVAKNLLTVSLGVLSLTMTSTQQKVVVGQVPPGSTVNLTSGISNGGTATLISSVEVLL